MRVVILMIFTCLISCTKEKLDHNDDCEYTSSKGDFKEDDLINKRRSCNLKSNIWYLDSSFQSILEKNGAFDPKTER